MGASVTAVGVADAAAAMPMSTMSGDLDVALRGTAAG